MVFSPWKISCTSTRTPSRWWCPNGPTTWPETATPQGPCATWSPVSWWRPAQRECCFFWKELGERCIATPKKIRDGKVNWMNSHLLLLISKEHLRWEGAIVLDRQEVGFSSKPHNLYSSSMFPDAKVVGSSWFCLDLYKIWKQEHTVDGKKSWNYKTKIYVGIGKTKGFDFQWLCQKKKNMITVVWIPFPLLWDDFGSMGKICSHSTFTWLIREKKAAAKGPGGHQEDGYNPRTRQSGSSFPQWQKFMPRSQSGMFSESCL